MSHTQPRSAARSWIHSEDEITPEQDAAIDRLYESNNTLLIAPVGFGKCMVGLTAAQLLIEAGELTRVLVLCPLPVAEHTWAHEAQKWEHLNPRLVALAIGTPERRHAALLSDAPIVVCNLENAAWVLEHGAFDGLLVDEMSNLKSAGGTTVKAIRKYAPKFRWRAGMTATPVADNLEAIYAQAVLLDDGKALGRRKDAFLRTFFVPIDYEQRQWEPKPEAARQIALLLRELVFVADGAAYLASLPRVTTRIVAIDFDGPDGSRLYAELARDDCLPELDIFPNTRAVTTGKLQQIAAGGLYRNNDDESRDLVWTDRHKSLGLQALLAVLPAEPTIIVYQYKFELEWLRRLFPDALVLGDSAKVNPGQIDKWNAGTIPWMLAHPKSFAHGLNLQGACRRMIHLGPLWSADRYAQAIGRICRRGQQAGELERFILMTRGTLEHEVLERVTAKAKTEREFMLLLDDPERTGVR